MVSASKKTYTTEEVSQKISETDDEEDKDYKTCDRFSIFFADEKYVDFDVNTAENANDDVPDNDFFVNIFVILSTIMKSSNYYLF